MKKAIVAGFLLAQAALLGAEAAHIDYKLLATTKTSSMEKEMNESAQAGFSFSSAMGGETAFGGKEVVVIMSRASGSSGQKTYKLLAANKTSTLEKEMQQAADDGFEYKGQTVFESAFGGREVSVIMERDRSVPPARTDYRLLATSRTKTMEKELAGVGAQGYHVIGMTVSKTSFGGSEVVCILRKALE